MQDEHAGLAGPVAEFDADDFDAADFDAGAYELTLAEDLRQLADEAKALAQAEFAFQKSRAAYAGVQSRKIAVLLVVAVVLVFFAAMAAVVGAVIALGPVLGLWGAMAAVTLALVLLAAACALGARAKMRRMMAIIGDGKDT